jgi:hypothetical protein
MELKPDPILEKLKKDKKKRSLGTDYKDKKRFQKIRSAIKNIKRKNSNK